MKPSKKIGTCVLDLFAREAKGIVYVTPSNTDCLTTAFAAVRASIKKIKISEAPEHNTEDCIAVRLNGRHQLDTLASRREVAMITAEPVRN
ncbi:MAG: hypothetical protein RBR86_03310 [Pseudobdellovibrionaceae bacterium]|jgi:hypothetical protein|nr:hypothetical protein [Pseudobdellovibrionaceae bacterium]